MLDVTELARKGFSVIVHENGIRIVLPEDMQCLLRFEVQVHPELGTVQVRTDILDSDPIGLKSFMVNSAWKVVGVENQTRIAREEAAEKILKMLKRVMELWPQVRKVEDKYWLEYVSYLSRIRQEAGL